MIILVFFYPISGKAYLLYYTMTQTTKPTVRYIVHVLYTGTCMMVMIMSLIASCY